MRNCDISFSIYLLFSKIYIRNNKKIREWHTSSSLGFMIHGSLSLPYNCGDSLQVV
jgi:hypothetical protein